MFRAIYLLLLVSIASSCGGASAPPPGILRISFSTYPTTFDPRKSGDFTSASMVCLLYEGLTRCLPDGTQELAIAEKIDISKDKKTYLFHLRKTFWSDGKPVTAFDFEQSWKQSLNPSSFSISAYLFYPILNAEAACRGTKDVSEVGIRALDELTLEVRLTKPTSYFLSLTSYPSFFPAPQHCLSQIESPQFLNHLTTNGPFLIEKIYSQSSIVLRKNPTFWNEASIGLEGINILILPNETIALEMFQQGELDWLGGHLAPLPPDAIPSLQGKLRFFPMAASTFCTFNVTKPPFSNIHLRKAFSLAIDREEITREILPTNQIPATRCIPPSLDGGRNRALFPPFDPYLAKKHFDQGIKELGTPLSSITLYYRFGALDGRIAQVLQQRWEEVLGVKVVLEQSDFKTHKDRLHQRNYEIALANWIAQYQDPINILERFKSQLNAKNYPGFENLEFSSELELAEETIDAKERSERIDRAEEILIEATPIALLYHWNSPSLYNNRVQNVNTTPSGSVLFERCKIANDF